MKKFMSLVLAGVLCLSLVACGGGDTPAPSNDPAPAPSQDAPAGEVITLKLSSNAPVNDKSMEYLAGVLFQEKVAEYSNGTMKVEYFPAAQLGSSTEQVEGCSMGTIEMVASLSWDLYANMEPSAAVMNMPYLFKDYDHMKAGFEGDNMAVNTIKENMINNIDVRVMGYGYRPFRNVIIAKDVMDTLTSPADLAGLNMRSPEAKVNMDMISTWGASPVTITLSELFTSMSNGTVHAAENDVNTFFDSSFMDVTGILAETDHMVVSTLLVCNNSFYESLTPEQQEALDKASADYTNYTWENFESYMDVSWKGFEDAGVTCIHKEDLDIDAFRDACKDVYKYFIDAGWFTEEMYTCLRDLQY